MASSIPPPTPVSLSDGDDSARWKFFRAQWVNYEIATGLDTKGAPIRVATLLSIMGEDCFKIYQNLPLTAAQQANVTDILDAIELYFEPLTHVIYDRMIFNSTNQEQTESIDQYVNKLRRLSDSCAYTTFQDELIRDRIVVGNKNPRTRAQLSKERNLTLASAIDICRANELADRQFRATDASTVPIHRVDKQKNFPPSTKGPSTTQHNSTMLSRPCNFCGTMHLRDRLKCPAHGKTCNNCGTANHFSSVCRQSRAAKASNFPRNNTKHKKPKPSHQVEPASVATARDRFDCTDWEEDEEIYALETANHKTTPSTRGKQWFVTLQILGDNAVTDLRCQLDNGSTCNCIRETAYDALPSNSKSFRQVTTFLSCYDRSTITSPGVATLHCLYNNKGYDIDFLVVPGTKPSLLSGTTCVELGLMTIHVPSTDIHSVTPAPTPLPSPLTKQKLLTDYKDVFEGLGCLPGEYHLVVDKDVEPVQHRPRNMPVALREPLKLKLDELEKMGVLTKVNEPTKWISNMVLVRKPLKADKTPTNSPRPITPQELRICLDPKDLNRALQIAKYPLPTIEDILPQVKNAKVFTVLDAKDGFWQVKLDQESSLLTTFWTPFGRYRWLRMPFGISSAPEEYQRRQAEALEGLDGVAIIADDTIIFGCGETIEAAILLLSVLDPVAL